MCDECGVSVDTSAVVSWRGVSDGRQLFWQCRACGGKSSLVLSNQVLRVLSKSFVYPVDEGLMTFWVGELADVNVEDVVLLWDWQERVEPETIVREGTYGG